jgi:hypothetical protein
MIYGEHIKNFLQTLVDSGKIDFSDTTDPMDLWLELILKRDHFPTNICDL